MRAVDLVVEGSGPPLVLIHGLGLDMSLWEDLARYLVKDYTVIKYDLLGHGQAADLQDANLKAFDLQLLGILDEVGLDQATLIGLSLGGVIARSFAARYPDRVRALVLLNTIGRRSAHQKENVRSRADDLDAGRHERVTDAALERWFGDSFQTQNSETVARIRRRLSNNRAESYRRAYRLFAEVDEEIRVLHPKIVAPTLVITGSDDLGSTPAMAHEIAGEITGAHVTILPGLRHLSVLEDPAAVHEAMAQFLSEAARCPENFGA